MSLKNEKKKKQNKTTNDQWWRCGDSLLMTATAAVARFILLQMCDWFSLRFQRLVGQRKENLHFPSTSVRCCTRVQQMVACVYFLVNVDELCWAFWLIYTNVFFLYFHSLEWNELQNCSPIGSSCVKRGNSSCLGHETLARLLVFMRK